MSYIPFEKLSSADLVIDSVYQGARGKRLDLGSEPLTKLIPGVGNMGGFRKSVDSKTKELKGLLLVSTRNEDDWPDSLDIFSGLYTYFGDNREPGRSLHDTPKGGNKVLLDIFQLAHGTIEERSKCPVILAFQNTGLGFDTEFKGLLVPGAANLSASEDLVAVWAAKNGKRFQNYRANFTVLNCGEISGDWVRDVFRKRTNVLDDPRTPKAFLTWIKTGKYAPLSADPKRYIRSVEEQIPRGGIQIQLINHILKVTESVPTDFEPIAAGIWQLLNKSQMEIDVTRRNVDGGRDAVGHLVLGPVSDPIRVPFALEAKRYKQGVNVGVKDMARLISRIKHRDFGVLVTTSAVSPQTYGEVRQDRHPIVIVSGRDIAEVLIAEGVNTIQKLDQWVSKLDFERSSGARN
jgi:hypothetical protein